MAEGARESRVAHTATARVDTRTKQLVKRVQPGEIMVIDHADLDRVAAETIVEAQAGGVINASASISGRYPNLGPLLVCAAGIPLIDGVGADVMSAIADGQIVTIDGGEVLVDGEVVASGTRQSMQLLEDRIETARQSMGEELERFAENTLSYLSQERHLLLDEPDIPDIALDMKDRHVLIVVRGADYKEDLAHPAAQRLPRRDAARCSSGSTAAPTRSSRSGTRPTSSSATWTRCPSGPCAAAPRSSSTATRTAGHPGSERLDELGLEHVVYAAAGTSEDIAMLLAYEKGAELIVAVGTHSSMVEFFDKGRAGMASTFLVRMKVGPILVDAKGVSRLYHHTVRKGDLALLVLSAIFTLVVIILISEPVRLVLRGYWLTLTS